MCIVASLRSLTIWAFSGLRWWIMFCTCATQRHVLAHISSVRRDSQRRVSRMRNDSAVVYNRLELDSHADTIVLGSNCVILSHTGRECNVSPYTETYSSIRNVPIVSGATAWTCQETGDTYILVFHESLWMGDIMDHTLVNPNQLRHFGIKVQDNPYGGTEMHLSTESNDMYFPLRSEGTMIYLDTCTPTEQELHEECVHIQLSSKSPWNPHAVQFPEFTRRAEAGTPAINRTTAHITTSVELACSCVDVCSCAGNIVCPCPQQITERLIAQVRVPEVLTTDVPGRRTFISDERHTSVTPAILSERWCIGIVQARNMIKVTTQKGVRSAILPLSRRYRADRVFERPLL